MTAGAVLPSLRAAVAERLGEAPECRYGFPQLQLQRLLGERFEQFRWWSGGSTAALCDGRVYDHRAGTYEPSGCGPHGLVAYSYDVARFLSRLPIND